MNHKTKILKVLAINIIYGINCINEVLLCIFVI